MADVPRVGRIGGWPVIVSLLLALLAPLCGIGEVDGARAAGGEERTWSAPSATSGGPEGQDSVSAPDLVSQSLSLLPSSPRVPPPGSTSFPVRPVEDRSGAAPGPVVPPPPRAA